MTWPNSKKSIRLLVIFMALTATFSTFSTINQTAIAQSGTKKNQTTNSWPMFHHDPGFTGYTESLAPNSPNLLWNYTLSGGVMCASPAVVDGRLFIQSEDNHVFCLNATTGAFVWKYRSELPMEYTQGQYHPNRASPAVAEGMVYIGSIDDCMYCLNATTGAVLWKYETGDDLFSFVTVAEGKVFTGSADFNLYCFKADTGELAWKYNTGDWPFNPAVVDGKVFAGSHDRFLALDANTGSVLWTYTASSVISDSPAVASGKVFFADGGSPQGWVGSRIHCLDADTGTIVWSCDAPPAVFSSPAVAYGRVFVGSWDKNVYCLNPVDGAVVWSCPTGGSVASSPAIADGKLFVANTEHTPTYPLTRGWGFHCINMTDGKLVWKLDNPLSYGAVADGYLVAANSWDGYMYVIGKGKSATTVTAPDVAVPLGSGVMIKGTVLDMSPAQTGTPCVSKDSMSMQMEYLHLSMPQGGLFNNETITGVPVSLTAIASDGTPIDLGIVTSNGYSGAFNFAWTPPKEDTYQIIASFAGDDSYGSSISTTAVSVGQAPEKVTIPEQIVPTDYTMTIMGVGIAVIIAVVIAVAIAVLILRKR